MAAAHLPEFSPFDKIATEIRLGIFSYCELRTDYDGQAPALLLAMTRTRYHAEVMDVYKKTNYTLTLENEAWFGKLRMKELMKLEHVVLIMHRQDACLQPNILPYHVPALDLQGTEVLDKNSFYSITIDLIYPNLLSPTRQWVDTETRHIHLIRDLVRASTEGQYGAMLLRLRIPALDIQRRSSYVNQGKGFIALTNHLLGIEGRMENVPTDGAHSGVECWFWEKVGREPLIDLEKERLEVERRSGLSMEAVIREDQENSRNYQKNVGDLV